MVRRSDDAGSTRLRAAPEERAEFAIDDIDGEVTDVADGTTVAVLSVAGEYTLVQTGPDRRQGYLLSSYLFAESANQLVAAETRNLPRGGREVEFDSPAPSRNREAEFDGLAVSPSGPSAEALQAAAAALAEERESRVAAIVAAKEDAARYKAAARQAEDGLRGELLAAQLAAQQEQHGLAAQLQDVSQQLASCAAARDAALAQVAATESMAAQYVQDELAAKDAEIDAANAFAQGSDAEKGAALQAQAQANTNLRAEVAALKAGLETSKGETRTVVAEAAAYVLNAACSVYTCRGLIDLSLIAGTWTKQRRRRPE